MAELSSAFKIQENISLRAFNTFGLNVSARHFVEINSIEALQELVRSEAFIGQKRLILGGGSNVLLRADFDGLVIRNCIKGISHEQSELSDDIVVKAMAGENWHTFVMHCISQDWAGIENLSLIPGCVGAAPMQNIGAYGVEIKDVFHRLEAVDLESGELETFRAEDCEFGYRESIFKKAARDRYCIVSLSLRLQPAAKAKINTTYGAIAETLAKMEISEPGIREVSEAVIRIRQSKLPDPADIGNAGSFFKNPELPFDEFDRLLKRAPGIPYYPLKDGMTKVPAGWLIEQAGWKGKRVGATGAHARQALVLVNYGEATGDEIWAHAMRIQKSVSEQFGVLLQPEVNVI